MTVQQRAKFAQGRDREARVRFVGELLTGHRIQHPGRNSHLHVIGERDDDALSRIPAEATDDLYRFAVERVVTVVDDGGGRFMGSVRMRCGTHSQPTCSRMVMTFEPCKSCSGIRTFPRR